MNFANILDVVIPLAPIFAPLLPSDSSLYLIADLLVIFFSVQFKKIDTKAAFFNADHPNNNEHRFILGNSKAFSSGFL
jgi:hypothetical protein